MSIEYVRIADEGDTEAIEIPTEEDGTIFLSSVSAQFPGVCGLKYRNPETQSIRGIKLLDGVLYPPGTENTWKDFIYLTVYPKDNKRKMEDEDVQSVRSKRPAQKCSDLIVLGLPWKVDEKDLESYFKPYGELVMTMVKRDDSGKSRGYGFIRYANYEAQESVIGKPHFIEGRRCEVKVPHSKEEPRASNKIFVGRISESMTKEDLRSFFEQFGTVDDVFIPAPFRSFAFVTFRESSVAQKLIGEDHVIKGVSVYINNADPKGSKESSRHSSSAAHGNNMTFEYTHSYSGNRGGNSQSSGGSSRYFPGNSNPSFSQFPSSMAQNNPGFNSGNMPYSSMNPAVLAAALDTWNTMVNGMFASGAVQGRPSWQGNSNDMKKDGSHGNWGGKGDNKWP